MLGNKIIPQLISLTFNYLVLTFIVAIKLKINNR
jgi:hypothetical protein